jgi:hypothetical protein
MAERSIQRDSGRMAEDSELSGLACSCGEVLSAVSPQGFRFG